MLQVTGLTRNLQHATFCCKFNSHIISKLHKLISNDLFKQANKILPTQCILLPDYQPTAYRILIRRP